jgi:hypothetical protein
LTVELEVHYLKSMSRNGFCVLVLAAFAQLGGAQQVPGRDLLEFPLGSLAEGAALSLATGDGFRNPAAIALPRHVRARFSVSSLTTGSDQGVAGQILAAQVLFPTQVTAGITIARAAVEGIVRTESDPQAIGGEVPYHTLVVSAIAARRPTATVTTGMALRYQMGELEADRKSAAGIDAGVIVERLLGVDGRLGLTSFLWRPGSGNRSGAAFAAAFDGRVLGRDSLSQLRAGYSFNDAQGLSREHFVSTSARLGAWEGRAGIAWVRLFARTASRSRLALGFHYARYAVGVSREESPLELAPVYHFTFITTLLEP